MSFNIYLLPGMGSDGRLFSRLSIPKHTVHHLHWVDPGDSKDLVEYSQKMANEIKTENNVLIGVSMGGIVAVEMAKILKPESAVLISAPARASEFSNMLRTFRVTNPQRFLPTYFLLNPGIFTDKAMQFQSKEGKALFMEMLRGNDPKYLRFAMTAVFRWNNEELPERFIQIIGSRDRLFDPRKMFDPIEIEGAGHFAAFESHEKINRIINDHLDSLKV